MKPDTLRTRVITLTDAAPVRIIEADWATLVQGTGQDDPLRADIRAREHRDGRLLTYGTATEGRGETLRAGFLRGDDADPTPWIRAVAVELIRRAPGNLKLHRVIMAAADDAVAKLPLEDI